MKTRTIRFRSGYQHISNGHYKCSKGNMYFRSKWEANIALYLDFLKENKQIKEWEYEKDCFIFEGIKFGTKRYLPDFKITNNNDSVEYWEVKGYMDSKSKTKLRRMKKYYPDVKVVLLDSKAYKDVLKKLKGVLKFY